MNFHGGQFHEDGIIDFSVNIPQLEYPDGFEEVIRNAFMKIGKYPDIDGSSAKNAIAEYNNVRTNQIVLGNGATELIYLMSRALDIKKATIIQPTFTEYNRALVQNNIEVTHFYLDPVEKFEIDLQKFIRHLDETESDMLVLCNPNNPTGNLVEPKVIEEILLRVQNKKMMMMIDESFMDFVTERYSDQHRDEINDLINNYPIVIIRSLTKNFMIPGIRVGYAIGSEYIVKAMNSLKEPWSLNIYALECIPFLLKQNEYLKKIKKWCHEERSFMMLNMNKIKHVTVFNGCANFILFRLDEGSTKKFMASMIQGGTYIRPCDDFMGLNHQYFRVALRNREDNIILIKNIMEAIQ